jgi:hypothetical protein
LKPQNEIHPAPLLIGFAAFQIGSPLRGDGDEVGNFLHRATLHRSGTGTQAHPARWTVFRPLNSFWGCSHNKKFMPAAGVVRLFGLFFLI